MPTRREAVDARDRKSLDNAQANSLCADEGRNPGCLMWELPVIWPLRRDLGRFFFTQADSEFDRCIKRRGEALALFLDEEPTYGHFPPVYYYQGRVREELKT
jgi:hypothetical protein